MLFNKKSEEDLWPSISDLMSGLMIIFLLIAIAYMHHTTEGKLKAKRIAVAYQEAQIELYNSLHEEFKEDLPHWKAVINKETLSIQFFEPEILFKAGESGVTNKFKEILNDFFPRYLNIIFSEKFKDHIAEVRIEGHTSSEWSSSTQEDGDAYFHNMQLSQARTRAVLQYCYSITQDKSQKKLMEKHITANGLSSSKLIFNENGHEDSLLSRRVEFRTRTTAENKIVQILEELNDD